MYVTIRLSQATLGHLSTAPLADSKGGGGGEILIFEFDNLVGQNVKAGEYYYLQKFKLFHASKNKAKQVHKQKNIIGAN